MTNTPIKRTLIVHFTNSFMLTCVVLTLLVISTIAITLYRTSPEPKTCPEPITIYQPVERKHSDTPLAKRLRTVFKLPETLSKSVADVILKNTNTHRFPSAELVAAVIHVESEFKHSAESKNGATGLMQVMSFNRTGDTPLHSVSDGVKILREYYAITGTVEGALNAYRVGIGAHEKGKRNSDYVNKVMNAYRRLL